MLRSWILHLLLAVSLISRQIPCSWNLFSFLEDSSCEPSWIHDEPLRKAVCSFLPTQSVQSSTHSGRPCSDMRKQTFQLLRIARGHTLHHTPAIPDTLCKTMICKTMARVFLLVALSRQTLSPCTCLRCDCLLELCRSMDADLPGDECASGQAGRQSRCSVSPQHTATLRARTIAESRCCSIEAHSDSPAKETWPHFPSFACYSSNARRVSIAPSPSEIVRAMPL